MRERLWHVGLSPWIIQDGNYGDFQVGQMAEFALEFYAERGLAPAACPTCDAALVDPADSDYRIAASVVDAPDGVCVLDFGVRAYREETCPAAGAGEHVAGDIHLGIDPFFYFESLARRPGMPPLIYSWRIERILQVTAPLVRVEDGRVNGVWVGHDVLTADMSRRVITEVDATDAWGEDRDDTLSLHYVLCCEQLDVPPKNRRGAA